MTRSSGELGVGAAVHPLHKIPATGKRATWTEIQFFRVRDDKIVEHWVDVDIFSWFTQLGVIPEMG